MGDGPAKEGEGFSPTERANGSLKKLKGFALKAGGIAVVAALGLAALAAI